MVQGPGQHSSVIRTALIAVFMACTLAGQAAWASGETDAALQAYLAVGRPRLSQIFNGLHKAGILSVRKKGRTRLFRISDQAKAHFSDEHMEA